MTLGGGGGSGTRPCEPASDGLAYGGLAIGDMAEMLAAGGAPSPAPAGPLPCAPSSSSVSGPSIVMVQPCDDDEDDSDSEPGRVSRDRRSGRRKIRIEYIDDKSRRHITFSKRKAGIMKKAYELSTLTGTQVLLLVASETGHVYTFATPKLQPLITKHEGKNLIQACLNAPDVPAEYVQGGEYGDDPSAKEIGAAAAAALFDDHGQSYANASAAALASYPFPQAGAAQGAGPAFYPSIYAAAAAAAAAAAGAPGGPVFWPPASGASASGADASAAPHGRPQ